MRRLSLRHRRLRRERGAIAMIVALIAGLGVLTGVGAISVDIGSLYAQRRAVQNGADGVALALAEACAKSATSCSGAYASANFDMQLARLSGDASLGDSASFRNYANGVCFKNFPSPAPTPTCAAPAATPELIDCPAPPTSLASVKYVEAHTQTSLPAHILPSFFARALGFNGANVQACARAALGAAGFGTLTGVVPIAMSYCDWLADVGSPQVFQTKPVGAAPGYNAATNPWPPAAGEKTVSLAKNSTTSCPTFNGHVAPGGFAWLNQVSGTCSANVVDEWVQGNTGNNYECSLLPYWGQNLGRTILVPIFDCVSDTKVYTDCSTAATQTGGGAAGVNTYYHIVNYAAFYLSGWSMSGSEDAGSNNPNNPNYRPTATYMKGPIACPGPGNSGRCLSGWFTDDLTSQLPPKDPSDPSPNFGPTTVVPAG